MLRKHDAHVDVQTYINEQPKKLKAYRLGLDLAPRAILGLSFATCSPSLLTVQQGAPKREQGRNRNHKIASINL